MKKRFGQNFIFDTNLLAAIALDAEIEGENVVEIGTGAGTLTEQLAKRAKKVIGFEIDTDLRNTLDERLKSYGNVDLVFRDFMKCDMSEIEEHFPDGYKVVANLPYYITTPIVCRFIEEAQGVKSLTIMVQEEVAERFCAQPDTKEYGAITVALQSVADLKITRRVSRKMFVPPPNVDSAVVSAVFDRSKIGNADPRALRAVTRAAFAMRRKTLTNNLSAGLGITKTRAEELLRGLGISCSARGETLSPNDFVRLALALKEG